MTLLTNYLIARNIPHSDKILERFEKYYNLLIETNSRVNLTAVTDPEEVQVKHFIDSLAALDYLNAGDKVLDIGTGAGFPGIPLAILRPDCEFLLVDSLNKRVNFLNAVIAELGLKNVKTVHARAEDLDKSRKFDKVVSRAVAPLNILLEYTVPFIKVGGHAVIYKSANFIDELKCAENAAKELRCSLVKTDEFTLFNTDIRRVLLDFVKTADTPLIYPRNQNKPRKFPL